ncbi:hypothetical protein I6N96_09940 [Enterococcus sp. BWM-S5]|uniref:LXG domain-containing protein n=2 Tax=Enterococcus larvae TaxID=2794352 RepID=A0ABS4CJ04_9ENTE|nr:T7SS effector LXG polymorphic toxin [Enterococcus larvae]MBP1046608.1 hypothetical protein [Enterococcus larvae]
MSINFYIGEVQAQSSSAVSVANAYIQHAGTLKDSINTFLRAPLSGETYKSAKRYFTAVYPPISSALILVGESMIEAHTKFPEEFQAMVDTCDVEEDRLKAQIQQGQNLLKSYAEVLNKEEKTNQRMEQAYMRMQEGIGKLEEKLNDLYSFDAKSTGIFSEVEANLDNLEQGLSAIENCTAWNPSTGTFDISKLNLSWTKPINEAWREREERNKQEIQKRLARLNAYEIECIEYGGKYGKSWTIIKDGQRLSKKDHPELYALLEEYGEHLAKDQYTVKELKIIKNEVTYLPGAGIFGNLGAIDKLVKGLGALKVGQQFLDQMKNGITISRSDAEEVEIEIPKDVQRKIKKLSPEQKKIFDEALDKLSKGDKTGLNDHALQGDRKGQRAFDVKGKGTGGNRGGIRGVYERLKDGSLRLKDVIRGHNYKK